MESYGSDSVPDDYGSETDEDDSLVKVEAALKINWENTDSQHELVEKNMDRLNDNLSDSNNTGIR